MPCKKENLVNLKMMKEGLKYLNSETWFESSSSSKTWNKLQPHKYHVQRQGNGKDHSHDHG